MTWWHRLVDAACRAADALENMVHLETMHRLHRDAVNQRTLAQITEAVDRIAAAQRRHFEECALWQGDTSARVNHALNQVSQALYPEDEPPKRGGGVH